MGENPAVLDPLEVPGSLGLNLLVCVGILLSVGSVPAGALDLTYELAVRSPHVWRGITLRRFSVLNASVTAQHANGLAAQLWVGLDMGDGNGRRGEVQEIDLDLSYSWDFDRSALTLGYVALFFPGGIDPTGELYVNWQGKGWLSPRAELYYNANLLDDAFAQVSIGHRFREDRSWSPAVVANVAYAGGAYARFFGGSRAGFHHWGVQVDLDIRRPNRQRIKFRLGYSRSLDERVLPEQPVALWGGIYWTLSRSLKPRSP